MSKFIVTYVFLDKVKQEEFAFDQQDALSDLLSELMINRIDYQLDVE